MADKLVIVESPAKARTIDGFLGGEYEVMASIGHIRDLLPNAKGLPDDVRKKWWADYAVNVDEGFHPFYEVPAEKEAQVAKLRKALKGKTELVLATDEDREGEAIAWHLKEVLKPAKTVSVKRIAFHEITREAIRRALAEPRDLDMNLVEAQEARRILDRLYGYTLSPVLWSRVQRNLSAGRVQSPAVRLIVEREMERRNFQVAGYWSVKAFLRSGGKAFSARLTHTGEEQIASSNDFDDVTGAPREGRKVRVLNEAAAKEAAEATKQLGELRVENVKSTDGKENPAPPFMTTTLQQEANRKFGFASDRTMRVAQSLYEGIALEGETVGLITYMRTDSLSLSQDAVKEIREFIRRQYADCLPEEPKRYASKVKNAQEAHEAIRPTGIERTPERMARFLNPDQLKLYTLIWQRAVASQMKSADVRRTEITLRGKTEIGEVTYRATGKQVLFDGFKRLYEESLDEPSADSEDAALPLVEKGSPVPVTDTLAEGHETRPPARYTEATLIKKLEQLGIGRPSTYAAIMQVIRERGYVRKEKNALVPTFLAFLVMEVLVKNFHEVVALDFTATMDEALDQISEGKQDPTGYLREFFLGGDHGPGLKPLVDERRGEIPFPSVEVGAHPETGRPILVRLNKEGAPFLQMGVDDQREFANIPDEVAPGDLTLEKALQLFAEKSGEPEVFGLHPETGRPLLLKKRGNYYLEVERTEHELAERVKPTWISLPADEDPHSLSKDDLDLLCRMPMNLGAHPETGLPIEMRIGRYGPYIESGSERRTVDDWRAAARLSVEQAAAVLAQPPRRGPARATTPEVLADLGGEPLVRVLSGRFGPYITDGTTNVTVPKDLDPRALSRDEAWTLLEAKRAAGSSSARRTRRKPAAPKRAATRSKKKA
jgi:DNA topoisomerase-1